MGKATARKGPGDVKPFLTRKEVCAELGVSKNRFYELVKAGVLHLILLPTYSRKRFVRSQEVAALKRVLAA